MHDTDAAPYLALSPGVEPVIISYTCIFASLHSYFIDICVDFTGGKLPFLNLDTAGLLCDAVVPGRVLVLLHVHALHAHHVRMHRRLPAHPQLEGAQKLADPKTGHLSVQVGYKLFQIHAVLMSVNLRVTPTLVLFSWLRGHSNITVPSENAQWVLVRKPQSPNFAPDSLRT